MPNARLGPARDAAGGESMCLFYRISDLHPLYALRAWVRIASFVSWRGMGLLLEISEVWVYLLPEGVLRVGRDVHTEQLSTRLLSLLPETCTEYSTDPRVPNPTLPNSR